MRMQTKSKTEEEFKAKFRSPTDECITPSFIKEQFTQYFEKLFNISPDSVIDPFFKGGDYKNVDYRNKVVLANPPFSIFAKIVDYYIENDVPFVLFAPALTVISTYRCRIDKVGLFFSTDGSRIKYEESGAKVSTAFMTNMTRGVHTRRILDIPHKVRPPRVERSENVYTGSDFVALANKGIEKDFTVCSYNGKKLYGGAVKVIKESEKDDSKLERVRFKQLAKDNADRF